MSDEWLAGFPEATFYHTRAWAAIVGEAFPGLRDESRAVSGSSVLPLFGRRRAMGLVTTRQSSFPFLYGGPVPRFAGGGDLLPVALRELRREGDAFELIANPFAPQECEAPSGIEVQQDWTHILRLPTEFHGYWDGVLETAQRNDVRRITKKGLTIRTGGSDEEILEIYRLYLASFERWGGRPAFVYPQALYTAMLRLGKDAVRLYVAEHEGRIAGGAFVVRWNRHVHYHAGYFDHEARSLRPNVLIQVRIVEDAIRDGYVDYDLLPSGGNAGVERFKESFGGVRTPIRRYRWLSPAHRLARGLLRERERVDPPALDAG